MYVQYPNTTEERWSILNDSRATHGHPGRVHYFRLLSALDTGWEVEAPIYARPRWNNHAEADAGEWSYHFVLHRDAGQRTTLLSVPDCDEVRQLIADQGWAISSDRV